MPSCRLPDGTVIAVGSCEECNKVYSGGCFEDNYPGSFGFTLPCFVRNVLVRTLGDALLDVGSSGSVSAAMVHWLTIGHRKNVKYAETGRVTLTPKLRQDLAKRVTGGIMQLAGTYLATVDFRDHILLKSARGRELKAYYDTHLNEIYHVTALDLELLHEAASTWLSVYPFVNAMVQLAAGGAASPDSQARLSEEDYERSKVLIGRFRKASKTAGFRKVLEEIEQEFEGYRGLSAAESLEKLLRSSARS